MEAVRVTGLPFPFGTERGAGCVVLADWMEVGQRSVSVAHILQIKKVIPMNVLSDIRSKE